MRFLQIPLWLSAAFGVAIYFGTVDKDLASALIFAAVFGLVYGGSASLLKPPSMLGKRRAQAYQGGLGKAPYSHLKTANRKRRPRRRVYRAAGHASPLGASGEID